MKFAKLHYCKYEICKIALLLKKQQNDMSKEILYEDDNRMLIWDEDQKDLIWINDDTVNYIEATDSLFERYEIISYFGEFLPLEAFSYVVSKVKGKI